MVEHYKTEAFNHTLNHSTTLVSRMERFEAYRNELTSIICREINEAKQLYVFAAGNLADVDYSVLFNSLRLEQIILSDIDLESMQEGILMYDVDGCAPQISFEAYNYLGVETDQLISAFVEEMHHRERTQSTDMDIYELIDELIDQVCHQIENISVSQTVDSVIVLPIYTQLLYIHLDAVLYMNSYWINCHLHFFQQMTKIIQAFNNYILKRCEKECRLIVISDIVQISPDQAISSFDETMSESNSSASQMIETYLKHYEESYGIGLGSYGLMHMESCRTLKNSYYLEWPFDEDRTFLVKVGIF